MRAADSDRERTAETLRAAAGEGRLDAEELEQRLEVALSARTLGELEAVVADLPRQRPAAAAVRPQPELRRFLAVSILLVAIWALTGMGYFWPVWPILGWGMFVVGPARRIGFGPCRPSASSRP
jgi:hypothetical protein